MVLFGGCIVAHVGAMWRRAGRQRAVAGEGMPGGTAGERRRGRRIGADVPTLTSPDFVLTSGAQVAPTCGAVAGGHRRAGDARANGRRRGDVVPGPTKPVQPLTAPRRRAPSRTCDRPQRPRNPPPTKTSRQRPRKSASGGRHAGRSDVQATSRVPAVRRSQTPCRRTHGSRAVPRPGGPAKGDLCTTLIPAPDPSSFPPSRESRDGAEWCVSHPPAPPQPSPYKAVAPATGNPGTGQSGVSPTPLLPPPNPPLQGRRWRDGQQTNPLFVPLPASKAATKKQ